MTQTAPITGSGQTVYDEDGNALITFPDHRTVYDNIMREIEPDLLSDVVDTIDEKYVGESETDHQLRMQRYEKAFAEYDVRYEAWANKLTEYCNQLKKQVLQKAEEKVQAKEALSLQSLEAQFA